ncbi:hypothetical protein Tco_1130110 [Tanacetum coccineum]
MDSLFCPHCEDGVESIDHAFIFCNMASTVWSKVFNWWKLGPVNAFTTKDILNHAGDSRFLSQNKLKWQATVWITGYMLWQFAKRGALLWQLWVFNPLDCFKNADLEA